MSTEKVARPATPYLDLLEALADEVYAPVGYQKLASAGQIMRNPQELLNALSFGAQVSHAAEMAQANQLSPVDAHIAKVASMFGQQPSPTDVAAQFDAAINEQIDANPALAQKMAAAFAA